MATVARRKPPHTQRAIKGVRSQSQTLFDAVGIIDAQDQPVLARRVRMLADQLRSQAFRMDRENDAAATQ